MLLYRNGGAGSDLYRIQWMDAAGRTEPLPLKPAEYISVSLSPDGRRLAASVANGPNQDIWVYDLQRESSSRLTFGDLKCIFPAWSPDGRYVLFAASHRIYWTRADGAGKPQALTSSKEDEPTQLPVSFTPDGKHLAFAQGSTLKGFSLWTVAVEAGGDALQAGLPEPFDPTPFNHREPRSSPDGRWMAYESAKSGRLEVYVRSFPDRGVEWQVSSGGAHWPHWSRTTRELFFAAEDGRIMVAPYEVHGDSFAVSKPRAWSDKRYTEMGGVARAAFDLAPDSRRILALRSADGPDESMSPNHVTFLMNFFDTLRRRIQSR